MEQLKEEYQLPVYLFHEGKNSEAYRFFGVHKIKKGTYAFRVWAPHAVGVAVAGDFNDWSETANPMTLIAPENGKTEYMGNLITLTLPLDRQEFLQTVAVLAASKSSFTRRKEADEDLISNAKLVLMNTQDMTELQAHRFLQKESMRTGLKITDLAQKIINDFR
jgi:hypothetical protein